MMSVPVLRHQARYNVHETKVAFTIHSVITYTLITEQKILENP